MALLLPADKTKPIKRVSPANGQFFTREEVAALLDCQHLERLVLAEDALLLTDEEARMVMCPVRNERAMRLVAFPTTVRELQAALTSNAEAGEWLHGDFPEDEAEVDWIAGDVILAAPGELWDAWQSGVPTQAEEDAIAMPHKETVMESTMHLLEYIASTATTLEEVCQRVEDNITFALKRDACQSLDEPFPWYQQQAQCLQAVLSLLHKPARDEARTIPLPEPEQKEMPCTQRN